MRVNSAAAKMSAVETCTGGTTTTNHTGGTLQACTLAYLKATYVPPPNLPEIKSATYLVTMVDFAEPGDLGVFIDEETIKIAEEIPEDKVELLENYVVLKMPRNPRHDSTIQHMLENFGRFVLEGKPVTPATEEAIKTLRVLDALARSARENKEVEVGR